MKNIVFSSFFLLVFIMTFSSAERKSYDQLLNSCNQGNEKSCYMIGLKYYQDSDMDTIVKGTILLTHACNLNDSNACVLLGWMYLKGEKIEVGYDQAFDYFIKASLLKNGGGYQGLAMMYDNGLGVESNKIKAAIYHQGACIYGGPYDCYMAGKTFEEGIIVQKDTCWALELYNQGCSYGIGDECCKEYERLRKNSSCTESEL